MGGQKKRAIACLIAMQMLFSGFVAPKAEITAQTVASINFDTEQTTYNLSSKATLEEGRSNKALKLVRTNSDYATVDSTAINAISGDFTFSVWCYPNDDSMWTRVYDIGTGTDKYIFLAPSSNFGQGLPRFVMKNGGGEQVLQGNTALNLNQWNNIVVTRKDGVTTMYLNGFEVGSTSDITLNPSDIGTTTNNYLGKSQYDDDPYFDGMIDDFAVYASALSEDEVREIAAESYTDEAKRREDEKNAENAKAIAKYDRYVIETNFYNSKNEKIFQIATGETAVTAKIDVNNYMNVDGSVSAKMYSCKGDVKSEIASTQDKTDLAASNGTQITLTANVPEDFDYINVVVKDEKTNDEFDAGYIGKSDVKFPTPVTLYENPDDDPTYGAHDPSIFKDPAEGGKYWAYSSHNLIFESDDLINWTKHDYTKTVTVPDSAKNFITNNSVYKSTTVNGTYWAPDVIYVEGDDYPYWCYVSVSCGLGGRNSVISLLKCKSPGIWDGEYKDCGVVLASVENSSYKTNAIDSNIYTDTDGTKYFVWGSFWQGIQVAQLNDDGTIKGIDVFASGASNDTNNAAVLSKSQTVGSGIMATRYGVFGPEGPWMITNSETGYRYLFTSYGWLGTNYNIRIARSSTSTTLASQLSSGSTQVFADANGNKVGTAYASAPKDSFWGYKMIGSYKLGDGITYYGNGHNSVLNDNGEWYLVDHMRKVADATAYLQVRKMLWTKYGWPVVSPVGYTGEKVQKLDKVMLYGTWDLASVGHTIIKDTVTDLGSCKSKDADLPVESSEIVLMPDGNLGDGLGTWEFDNDHTVTITFAKDGDESKNQYFKSGDKLEMYALVGYDEDDAAHTVVMTGIDQNCVTQFAKKSNASVADTTPSAQETTNKTLTKSTGGNPVLGFDTNGNTLYAGDPAATVIGDTVYLYAGHDTSTTDAYVMPEWVLYTSKDMVNWEYKGVVMKASDVSWASNTTSAWASQVVEHNGKYYLYFCTWDKTDSGKQSIGVAVADSPEGPFKDKGTPLVKGSVTTPQSSDWNDIDPTVWVETVDGVEHRYLAWGNGKYYVCELNEDMISVTDKNGDGTIDMNDIKCQKIKNLNGDVYTEAPWLYKRGDKYYTFFASNWREEMAYATASSPYGPWEYCGQIMPPTATSNTNHPSVIDFNGKTYFIYHNGALVNGSGFRRSVCVEELLFDEDGNVLPLTETSIGVGGTANTILTNDSKYLAHEQFTNSSADDSYPIKKSVIVSDNEDEWNSAWEIVSGKYDKSKDEYVSIQSANKPGLYITALDGEAVITADDGTMAQKMTFKTVEGLNGKGGVSFESLSEPGKYLTSINGMLLLTYGRDEDVSSFTVREVSEIPTPTALPKPTPTPTPDLTPDLSNNFDSETTGTKLSIAKEDQDPITSIDGVTLYIGTRSDGADSTSNIAVETGGVTGNALVINSGKFVSASRGPRIQINTPVLVEDSKITAEFQVKLSSADAVLRYNDSTSSDEGTVISGLSTGWTKIRIEIANNEDEITRTMYVGDSETPLFTDDVETFPVLWGTTDNKKYYKVYLDNLSVKTVLSTDTDIEEVNGRKIKLTTKANDARAFAVKYADGALENIKIFDLVKGDNTIEVEDFEPDKVFVWSAALSPYAMWNKSEN